MKEAKYCCLCDVKQNLIPKNYPFGINLISFCYGSRWDIIRYSCHFTKILSFRWENREKPKTLNNLQVLYNFYSIFTQCFLRRMSVEMYFCKFKIYFARNIISFDIHWVLFFYLRAIFKFYGTRIKNKYEFSSETIGLQRYDIALEQ